MGFSASLAPGQPVFAMVAGELSGDKLGAGLIHGLRRRHPDAAFVGVGGPRMIAAGFESWFDLDRLSVNGYVDPLKRLPELLNILLTLRRRLLTHPPTAFVGVDFNFFNLLLEGGLKPHGIPVVHYVSPSVWAWRRGRLRRIARSVDLMLTLYPFEADIYRQHDIRVTYVGHPAAEEFPMRPDSRSARQQLGLAQEELLLAVLPGSRSAELRYSGETFLRAAMLCREQLPGLQIALPAASSRGRQQLQQLIAKLGWQRQVTLFDGHSRELLEACDVALVNSGTATLEAMLMKKPLVMSYRVGRWTYRIIRSLVHTEFFALPNIIAGRQLIPELIQDAATPERLAEALLPYLGKPVPPDLLAAFDEIHLKLRPDEENAAAKAVLDLVQDRQPAS